MSQLSIAMTKYLKKINLYRVKIYFGSSFRGFSPWSLDPVIFWPCGMAEAHGKSMWQRKTVYLMVAKKQTEGEHGQTGSQYPLEEHTSSSLTSFHEVPPPEGSTISQEHPAWWH
jgi:hypothetical protein